MSCRNTSDAGATKTGTSSYCRLRSSVIGGMEEYRVAAAAGIDARRAT